MLVLTQIIIGWLLADILSGVVHAIGDSQWLGSSRIVKAFANFNQDHHANPTYIIRQSFISRNLSSWIGTALIGGALIATIGLSPLVISMIAGGLMTSEVHRWAHAPSRAPDWVRWMQRTGLFQSPRHHTAHHRPPHGIHFCLLTDFCNPVWEWFVKNKA